MKFRYFGSLIIVLSILSFACSNVATILMERELKVDLEYAENLLLQGKYEAALSEFERLEKGIRIPPFLTRLFLMSAFYICILIIQKGM